MTARTLYYFTSPSHAVENLKNGWLKVSRFSGCNDPFELFAFNLRNKEVRPTFRRIQREIDQTFGLICFCESWQNPVVWGHYAQRHQGLCLQLEMQSGPDLLEVNYVDKMAEVPEGVESFQQLSQQTNSQELFATKYRHWQYEEEVRLKVALEKVEKSGSMFFKKFDADMALKRVYIGPRCEIRRQEIERVTELSPKDIVPTRIAFQDFKVTPNRRRLSK